MNAKELAVEALDRTLRDINGYKYPENATKPFEEKSSF